MDGKELQITNSKLGRGAVVGGGLKCQNCENKKKIGWEGGCVKKKNNVIYSFLRFVKF